MTKEQALHRGISYMAWGYFFLYFHFNINNINLLPSFVGYALFLSAIRLLAREEQAVLLLRTMGILLTAWHALTWVMRWFGASVEGAWQFADLLVTLVNLYFHFQLLTNIASIATKYQPAGHTLDARLLQCRTIQTVMLTAISLITACHPWLSELWAAISIVFMIVYLVAGFTLMHLLFTLRKHISTAQARQ